MLPRRSVNWIILPLTLSILSFFLLSARAGQVSRDYQAAVTHFEDLLGDAQKRGFRHHWMTCVHEFQSVLTREPAGPWADDALFMIGRVYAALYEFSSNAYDREEAVDHLRRLLKRFPRSAHRKAAQETIAELSRDAGSGKPSRGRVARGVERGPPARAWKGSSAEVKAVRFWSSPTYARVVIDMASEVSFAHRLVREDAAVSKSGARLLVTLDHAHVGRAVKPFAPSAGSLLLDARARPLHPDKVQVALRVKSVDHFKVFSLRGPFRIVIDVRSVPIKKASKKRVKGLPGEPAPRLPRGALARQLALGVQKIVIDPGHGGRDFGATGYLRGVFEKNVTLEISHRVAEKLRERLGCEAVLTRQKDEFLSLEERTAVANTVGADLFISIHTNAHKKMASHGVETYFLNLATDENAILVAARENAASARNMSDLEGILTDLMTQAKQEESSRLAGHIQESLVKLLSARFGQIKDKGVKEAPFYVLLGADMPCVLIEVAFITNPRECRRLNTAAYQEAVADAIARGIETYVRENHLPAGTQARANAAHR